MSSKGAPPISHKRASMNRIRWRMISHRVTTPLSAAVMLFAMNGCNDTTKPNGACAAPQPLSVVVTVTDSISGLPAAEGAIGTLVGRGITDTLVMSDARTLEGGSTLGTFTVRIERAGYATWTAADVRVTKKGPCGNVIPVDLTARLQPLTQ
jgi:hypothetical protein